MILWYYQHHIKIQILNFQGSATKIEVIEHPLIMINLILLVSKISIESVNQGVSKTVDVFQNKYVP